MAAVDRPQNAQVPDGQPLDVADAMAALRRSVAALPPRLDDPGGARALSALNGSVKALTELLTAPPAPSRPCPACGRLIMPAATLCGYCWTRMRGA